MKRRTLTADQLKTGTTFFIVTRQMGDKGLRYGVGEFLVGGKNAQLPEPGAEIVSYRIHPHVAAFVEHHTDCWRTRRDAVREAKRRQSIFREQINSAPLVESVDG